MTFGLGTVRRALARGRQVRAATARRMVLAGLAAWAAAQAGPAAGSEFQVNTFTIDNQYDPDVAGLPGGGFVVVWSSTSQDDPSFSGVFAQRYDGAGLPVGSEFQVNTYTTNAQTSPAVAGRTGGGFVVVWHSLGQDGPYLNFGIFGRRFSSTGAPEGTEFQVNTHTTDWQLNPAVAGDAGGGFVVAWSSLGQDEAGFFGIFGQRFDSAGSPVGSEFQVNTYTTGNQYGPAVAGEAGGGFVVVWQSSNQDAPGNYNLGIFGQRFDSAGSPVGGEFQVNTYTTGNQYNPVVAGEAGGGFVVVWQSSNQDDPGNYNMGVFGRRFDASGAALGGEFQVNTYTTSAQVDPAVAARAGGGFVVAWSSAHQDGNYTGVFGQRFDSAGLTVGGEFQVNTYTTGSQDVPAVAGEAAGGFVVVWQSLYQDGHYTGVFGDRFDAGSPPPTATPTASPTATPSVASCPPSPAAGCAGAGKSKVKIKNTGTPAQSQLLWKWGNGTATKAQFGNPTAATSYATCVYVDSALALEAVTTSDGNWADITPGYKYKNTATNADGIFKALLKEGSGKAKILVKGKGANLSPPGLPLNPAASVTVQLVKDPGSGTECWESVFPAPGVTDTATQFKDKTP